jgi:hypothetical protein
VTSRRDFLRAAGAAAAVAITTRRLGAAEAPPIMTVYRSPSCGCCKKWVEHIRAAGFRVDVKELDDLSEIKATLGVPSALQSCHTGVLGAYFIEGHVPADLARRLLKERPKILGLAVPGMPIGSPGMEGGVPERYDVIAFERTGVTRVYARR